MIRIYADFNNLDEAERVVLSCMGSLKDIDRCKEKLATGMKVILYMPNEFEVTATLDFDGVWNGIPDWDTIHYLNQGSEDTDSVAD